MIQTVSMLSQLSPDILNTYIQHRKKLQLLNIMDNSQIYTSSIMNARMSLKKAFSSEKVNYQLVPPHTHHRNAVERENRTLKKHITTGLCTCGTRFPACYWYKIIPHAIITLNLLRSSRCNSYLSAHTAIFGEFNFNDTPLAPPNTNVVVHQKKRKTYGVHNLDGWYVDPHWNTIDITIDSSPLLVGTCIPAQLNLLPIFLSSPLSQLRNIYNRLPPTSSPSSSHQRKIYYPLLAAVSLLAPT